MTTAPSSVLDKLRISDNPSLDRRRKLTDTQRMEIRKIWWESHEADRPTMTALGEVYKVHRTVIARVLDPERNKRHVEQQKLRARDGRYRNREKARRNLQSCRDYKLKLLQEGKLSM